MTAKTEMQTGDAVATKQTDKTELNDSNGDISSNFLMISNKRPLGFYGRAARELLASGMNSIKLSALGEAIPLAAQLARSLHEKELATISKIETKLVELDNTAPDRRSSEKPGYAYSAGILITLSRHPNFKGTRIIPNFVFFSLNDLEEDIKAFPKNPERMFASVNYGNKKTVFDQSATGEYFSKVLLESKHSLEDFSAVHEFLLGKALASNEGQTDIKKISVVGELEAVKSIHKGLKAAFCRVCPGFIEKPEIASTGSVFLYIFADQTHPHNNNKNSCMIHVVSPQAADFPDRAKFLQAVSLTATNLMTALCDFNGYTKRSSEVPKLRKLALVRIPLLSGSKNYIHAQTTVADVAEAMIKGLDAGYHFGPGPMINFFDPTNAVKESWVNISSQSEDSLGVFPDNLQGPEISKT